TVELQRGLLVCLFFVLAECRIKIDLSSEEYPEKDFTNRRSTLESFRNRKIPTEAEELTGRELIDYVNSHQSLWKAKENRRFARYPDRTKWGLMGVNHVRLSVMAKQHLSTTKDLDIDIPESFDSREEWPNCESIKVIRDQSSCGKCIGSPQDPAGRLELLKRCRIEFVLPPRERSSLAYFILSIFSCNGGDPLAAWKYWVRDGIVTGSNFTANQGCKPYPFPPCEHHSNKTHYDPCRHDLFPTPKCEKKCVPTYNEKSYNEDKYYGRNAYGVKDDVTAIQKEILTHGPVEVAFEVYEDFLNYAGGVYVHTGGRLGGGHAVKMIGWGVDQGMPYWLVANSWNTDWGEDGYFRILRGVDECGIESGVVGGVPKLNSIHRRRHAKRHTRRHAYEDDFF
ncbi:papain family cysteine protease, partial [Ostertagia ostertagi]